MQPAHRIALVIPVACLLLAACSNVRPMALPADEPAFGPNDTILYHGFTFKEAKSYPDFESYKDDPNNLTPSEIPQIEQAMLAVKPPAVENSKPALVMDLMALEFPGYGFASLGDDKVSDGSTLQLFSVEIPQRNRDRYFCYRTVATTSHLIDDFVMDEDKGLPAHASLVGSTLTYSDIKGRILRTATAEL